MVNPLHRIEHWTGKCFERAELRNVGVFLLIKHRETGMCNSLTVLVKLQEDLQAMEDEKGPSGRRLDDEDIGGSQPGDGADEQKPDAGESHAGHPAAGQTCCVVHDNGVHHLPLLICGCQGPEDMYLDLASARFLPTSFSRISTLFTTAVLDDFRLSNLECKASAYQYWQRLSRLTNPLDPTAVSNRYKELLRMSRQWRWMKKLKWAGVAHIQQKSDQVKDGQLSIFCPACPQPGINIPPDWKDDPKRCADDRFIIWLVETHVCRQMGLSSILCGRW